MTGHIKVSIRFPLRKNKRLLISFLTSVLSLPSNPLQKKLDNITGLLKSLQWCSLPLTPMISLITRILSVFLIPSLNSEPPGFPDILLSFCFMVFGMTGPSD